MLNLSATIPLDPPASNAPGLLRAVAGLSDRVARGGQHTAASLLQSAFRELQAAPRSSS